MDVNINLKSLWKDGFFGNISISEECYALKNSTDSFQLVFFVEMIFSTMFD